MERRTRAESYGQTLRILEAKIKARDGEEDKKRADVSTMAATDGKRARSTRVRSWRDRFASRRVAEREWKIQDPAVDNEAVVERSHA